MRFLMALAFLVAATMWAPSPARAQEAQCHPRGEIEGALADRWGEAVVWQGRYDDEASGRTVEFFAWLNTVTGTWTITSASGDVSCGHVAGGGGSTGAAPRVFEGVGPRGEFGLWIDQSQNGGWTIYTVAPGQLPMVRQQGTGGEIVVPGDPA